MSGIGTPCLALIPSSKMYLPANCKPSLKVRNGGFLPQKYAARTMVRAEMCEGDAKRGEFEELTIQGIVHIDEVVKRQSQNLDAFRKSEYNLDEAYKRCGIFCAQHSIPVLLGTLVLSKEQRRAFWALYAWLRRIDDLVDTPDIADEIRSASLDEWEKRTGDIFAGRPHDILDVALVDTISKFPLNIEPFLEMIKGMRMDTVKTRYASFEELFLYSFSEAGTLGLMLVPVFGMKPKPTLSSKGIYEGAVYFIIACHLTDILRDISEDAKLGRIYLPQDELEQFGLCDDNILSRKVTDGWRELMKMHIQRARFYFDKAEQGLSQLDKANRIPFWLAGTAYRLSLNVIELYNYDNLTNKPVGLSV